MAANRDGSRPPDVRGAPSDAAVLGRSLAIGLAGVMVVVAVIWSSRASQVQVPDLGRFPLPLEPVGKPAKNELEVVRISDERRKKGLDECTPLDPIGLGPYRPYQTIRFGGRLLVPQAGGHTDDMGFDVIAHFHGHEAARKMLVQVARGVVFVGFDKGVGSGPYSAPFKNPDLWPKIRASIESALKKAAGDDRAHVRHLGLSAWSAGYGAINRIVERHADDVDAVILLDGLHAAWNPLQKRGPTWKSATAMKIRPTFDYALRAAEGDKLFVFTHSQVDPALYPSTRQTADLMLHEMELKRRRDLQAEERFPRTGRVDTQGFHLWSYDGSSQAAHCDHLRHLAEIVRDVVEPAWKTPAMDRTVPFTKAPKLRGPEPSSPLVELVGAGGAPPAEGSPTADPNASKPPSTQDLDLGGLDPVPTRSE